MAELKLENIKVKRESFNLEIPLLCVSAGKILGVQGKSGSGKSTLLNAIAGFEPLEEGTILFDGKIISALPTELRRVAIVFQRPALFSHLNVLDNVCFGLKVQGMRLAERQKKIGRAHV